MPAALEQEILPLTLRSGRLEAAHFLSYRLIRRKNASSVSLWRHLIPRPVEASSLLALVADLQLSQLEGIQSSRARIQS